MNIGNQIYQRKLQKGLSLIELMISMVIGLIIVGAVIQAFLSSNQTYRIQEAQARVQEDGRAAMHFLTRDIRMADFWGCLPERSAISSWLDELSSEYNPAIHDFDTTGGINGSDNTGLNGSDSITLKGALGNGLGLEPPGMPTQSASLHVQQNSGLVENQVVLVSDCEAGDIFQITNDPSTGGGSDDTVIHNKGTVSAGPGNKGDNPHKLSKSYDTDAQIFALQTITYSIGADTDGEPVLLRDGQELVQNIENMQILYGEDLDGDLSADSYLPADDVTDMEEVVSIRIMLSIRSTDDNLTSNAQSYNYNGSSVTSSDNRIRHTFTSTITVRNRVN